MGRIYSTGPALIYAGVADLTGATAVYIGTGQSPPDIDIQGDFDNVMNDLGGNKKPFDRMWEGEEGMVSSVLNRLNYAQLLKMMSRPRSTGTPGLNVSGDVGSLMGQEGLTYQLWVMFPYATIKAAAYPDMVPGYHFNAAMLNGPVKIQPGTTDFKAHCSWQCQRAFSATPGLAGQFLLYDTLAASFSSLPPIN